VQAEVFSQGVGERLREDGTVTWMGRKVKKEKKEKRKKGERARMKGTEKKKRTMV